MATGTQVPYIIEIDITADATAGEDYTLIHPGTIAAISVYSTATNAGATATLSRQAAGAGAFNAVSAAIAATPVNTLTAGASLILAQTVCAAGDVLRIVTNGANDLCKVFITIIQEPQQ
jgi:hypothetical protein